MVPGGFLVGRRMYLVCHGFAGGLSRAGSHPARLGGPRRRSALGLQETSLWGWKLEKATARYRRRTWCR